MAILIANTVFQILFLVFHIYQLISFNVRTLRQVYYYYLNSIWDRDKQFKIVQGERVTKWERWGIKFSLALQSVLLNHYPLQLKTNKTNRQENKSLRERKCIHERLLENKNVILYFDPLVSFSFFGLILGIKSITWK